jgi:hypothetical protein
VPLAWVRAAMKDTEAADLASLLRAAFPAMDDEQEKLYARRLVHEPDAEAATRAILKGVETWNPGGYGNFTPSLAQVKEAIRVHKEQERLKQPRPPEPKRDTTVPEWVWVWRWARTQREPRLVTPLHYQDDHVDPTTILDEAQYERLRQEWVDAGSPKPADPLIGFVK